MSTLARNLAVIHNRFIHKWNIQAPGLLNNGSMSTLMALSNVYYTALLTEIPCFSLLNIVDKDIKCFCSNKKECKCGTYNNPIRQI